MKITEEEKQELERDVLLLKESMEILNEMIETQGETLDRVEDNVADTNGLVVIGTNQIESAEGYTAIYVAAAGIIGLFGSILIGLML
jgi:t-SNARE complex subunit (syntaxin)